MANEPFATPVELRNWLQLEQAELPDTDPTALLVLKVASGAVRTFCQWHVSAEVVTAKRIRSRGVRSLWLPTLWLRQVTALTMDGVAVSQADYAWGEEGRVELLRSWWRDATFEVSYEHGFEEPHPALDTMKGVVLSAAARLRDNPTFHRSETSGGEAVVAAGGALDVVSLLAEGERLQLHPYTLPELG